MSPNALDRTAAWLLTMNAQLLEDEGLGPDPPSRDRLRSKEELSQAEKVTLDPGRSGQGGAASLGSGRILPLSPEGGALLGPARGRFPPSPGFCADSRHCSLRKSSRGTKLRPGVPTGCT